MASTDLINRTIKVVRCDFANTSAWPKAIMFWNLFVLLVIATFCGSDLCAQGKQEQSKKKLESNPQDESKSEPDSKSKPESASDPQDQKAVELPWERKRENRIPKITKLNERELLGDVTEEEVLSIRDHVPLNQSSQHLFAKLLFRVPQFGLDNLQRLALANSETPLESLDKESGFHRLKVFGVEGIARSWEKRKLTEEVAELFDISFYYKVKLQTKQNQNVILYCRRIPDAWKSNQTLNESVRFQGLYVNWTWSKEKQPILNFVADRARWAPKTQSDLVAKKGLALLGSAGFDLGLLDLLPSRNKRRLDDEDTETFYQMLAAAKLVANSRKSLDWQKEVPEFKLIDALREPAKHHGELSVIQAQIRNVTRVKIEEEYIRDRIGIDHYYQLDGFVKFDTSVTYKGKDGEKGAVFKDKYPVCICINRLPKDWSPGTNQKYSATFPAFFFKVWAYPSGFQSKFSDEALQQSPLLIALDPIRFEKQSNSVNWTAIGLAVVLGIGLITIWTSYYVGQARKDRSASQFRLPSKVDKGIPDVAPKVDEDNVVPGMPVIKEHSDQ